MKTIMNPSSLIPIRDKNSPITESTETSERSNKKELNYKYINQSIIKNGSNIINLYTSSSFRISNIKGVSSNPVKFPQKFTNITSNAKSKTSIPKKLFTLNADIKEKLDNSNNKDIQKTAANTLKGSFSNTCNKENVANNSNRPNVLYQKKREAVKTTTNYQVLELKNARQSKKFGCWKDEEIYKYAKCEQLFVEHSQDDDKDSEKGIIVGAVKQCKKQLLEAVVGYNQLKRSESCNNERNRPDLDELEKMRLRGMMDRRENYREASSDKQNNGRKKSYVKIRERSVVVKVEQKIDEQRRKGGLL